MWSELVAAWREASGRPAGSLTLVRAAILVGATVTAIGLALWGVALAIGDEDGGTFSDMGSALVGAAVVAFAIFLLERRAAERSAQQDFRVQVGMQRDLKKADLSGHDLSQVFFAGKDLTDANFAKAQLGRASFLHATLVGTSFVRADLTGAVFSFADVEGAVFATANVTDATFTDVTNVDEADFGGAFYVGEPPRFDEDLPPGIVDRTPS